MVVFGVYLVGEDTRKPDLQAVEEVGICPMPVRTKLDEPEKPAVVRQVPERPAHLFGVKKLNGQSNI